MATTIKEPITETNDQYYYYPMANSGNPGFQQSSTFYQQQNQSTGVNSNASIEPVAIQFGGFAHTEELGHLNANCRQ